MPPEALRVLLVDDEPLARQGLRDHLAAHGDVEVVGEAGDGLAAVAQIEALRPDVVFLDVQMPGADGFEVLRLVEAEVRPVVVFVTAYEQYALRAFEAHAVDYLLKPFDGARFAAALQRARAWLSVEGRGGAGVEAVLEAVARRRRERFVVRHAGRLRIVPAAEVEWIEARGNYVHLHHGDGPFLLRETMTALQEALDPARFLRVHRSALVAVAAVVAYERRPSGDYELKMRSGALVPLGRAHVAEFEAAVGRRG